MVKSTLGAVFGMVVSLTSPICALQLNKKVDPVGRCDQCFAAVGVDSTCRKIDGQGKTNTSTAWGESCVAECKPGVNWPTKTITIAEKDVEVYSCYATGKTQTFPQKFAKDGGMTTVMEMLSGESKGLNYINQNPNNPNRVNPDLLTMSQMNRDFYNVRVPWFLRAVPNVPDLLKGYEFGETRISVDVKNIPVTEDWSQTGVGQFSVAPGFVRQQVQQGFIQPDAPGLLVYFPEHKKLLESVDGEVVEYMEREKINEKLQNQHQNQAIAKKVYQDIFQSVKKQIVKAVQDHEEFQTWFFRSVAKLLYYSVAKTKPDYVIVHVPVLNKAPYQVDVHVNAMNPANDVQLPHLLIRPGELVKIAIGKETVSLSAKLLGCSPFYIGQLAIPGCYFFIQRN